MSVRPRSSLSLKYLEIQRGRSARTLGDRGRLPASRALQHTEVDELLRIFDEPTRQGVRDVTVGAGNGLAGRGPGLNETIALLPPFLTHLEPVARTLADPANDLGRLFRELGDGARVLAPVAARYAESFGDGADTFEAFSRDPLALQQSIERAPPTLRTGTRSMRAQRPFLTDLTLLSEDLERSSREVRAALPPLTTCWRSARPIQLRSVALAAAPTTRSTPSAT